jgi:acetyl esterase/lipase
MPTLIAAVAAAAGLTMGTVATAQVAGATESGRVGVKTITYGSYGSANTMDDYTPPSAVGKKGRKLPTVVLVHGGSWIKGDKSNLASQAQQLAREGYMAVSINYRLATQAVWPAQRTDALQVREYLQHHQYSLNVDASRIVLLGSSAGAHIAAATAMYHHGADLFKGVVGLSGPLDPGRVSLDPAHGLDTIVTTTLMGCLPIVCPDRYNSSNAINRINRYDPASLMFASRNEWLDPQNSVDFVKKAQSVGLRSRMVWMDGSQHAVDYWDRAWPTIRTWLANTLKR